MCKELMYKIVYNEKLDWILKINWFLIWFPMMILFILALNYRPQYLFYIVPLYVPVGIMGFIRQMKDTPGNLELKFMRNSICYQLIFLVFVVLILIIVFLGRV